jgi:hypothetical protein
MGKVEFFQRAGLKKFGGHTQGGAEAVRGGHDREAKVVGLSARGELDAAFLGDVQAIGEELGHHHQTADDGAAGFRRNGGDGGKHTIDALADFAISRGRLDVNVRGAVLNSPVEQVGDEGGDVLGRGRHFSSHNAGAEQSHKSQANG